MRYGAAVRSLVLLSVALLIPALAAASAMHVVVEDVDSLDAFFFSGSHTIDVSVLPPFAIVQPGAGQFGEVVNQFDYLSVSGGLPAPGQSLTRNYNLFEDPGLTALRYTMALTFTGHLRSPSNDTNVTVDVLFRSASLDGVSPPPYDDGLDVFLFDELARIVPGHPRYRRLFGPLQDFEVDIAPVPEPGVSLLLGLGMAGALARAGRRRSSSGRN